MIRARDTVETAVLRMPFFGSLQTETNEINVKHLMRGRQTKTKRKVDVYSLPKSESLRYPNGSLTSGLNGKVEASVERGLGDVKQAER